MKNKKKRKIHNTIRDATENDIKNYNAPKNTKYKIVFSSPQGKTNIPKKFQGVQYFATKKEAENALNDRLNLTQKLKYAEMRQGEAEVEVGVSPGAQRGGVV